MRFSKYILLENNDIKMGIGRSKPLTLKEFNKLHKKHCKKYYDSPALYRGIKTADQPLLFIDPSQHIRNSQYSSNLYMLLMEILPEWKEYPRLSRSIICASSDSAASGWGGDIYQVYPYDDAILAITPGIHMWASFDWPMDSFNHMINFLITYGISPTKSDKYQPSIDDYEKNPNVLKDFIKRIDANKEALNKILMNISSSVYDFWRNDIKYFDTDNDLLTAIGKVFNPNRFSLKKIGQQFPTNKQVWTESPCLLELYEGI